LEKVKTPPQTSPTLPLRGKGPPRVPISGVPPSSVIKNGVKNELPQGSLSFSDFSLKRADFQLRAGFVANKIGAAKIVSRITTAPASMEVRGAADLKEWWEGATPLMKWLVLTNSKHAGLPPPGCDYTHLKGDHVEKLLSLECPFPDARTEIYSKDSLAEDDPEGNASAEESEDGVLVYE
jgi:hypothetical protein